MRNEQSGVCVVNSKNTPKTADFRVQEVVMDTIWAFLQDETNRTVLAWIGGGVVVVVGGLWAAFKFLVAKEKPKHASPTVSVAPGGVGAGRDIRNSKIDTRGGSKR
jgi:hypothetical protein